jgi:hypothetical protein
MLHQEADAVMARADGSRPEDQLPGCGSDGTDSNEAVVTFMEHHAFEGQSEAREKSRW